MHFECHTLSWCKSAPSHTQSVKNFRPLSYLKGQLIYQISTSNLTMRRGHSSTALTVISMNDWRSHTEDDKKESKKFRVEEVSGGHQVQPSARSSTITNTTSSQSLLWPFLEKLEDIDSTSSPGNYGLPML